MLLGIPRMIFSWLLRILELILLEYWEAQLCLAQRGAFIALTDRNVSIRKQREIKFDESTVRRFIKYFCETRQWEYEKGLGRKKYTNFRKTLKDRFKVQEEIQMNIWTRTVQLPGGNGFVGKEVLKKPLLIRRMKKIV